MRSYYYRTCSKYPLKMLGEFRDKRKYIEMHEKFNPKFDKIDYEIFQRIEETGFGYVKPKITYYFLNVFDRFKAIKLFHEICGKWEYRLPIG